MTISRTQPPIAVTGVGTLFPGNTEPDGFWRTIVEGRDCLTDIPESHWLIDDYYDPEPATPGKTYARRGAFLSAVSFEPLENGIPPNQAPSTDTAQLLALMVARRVLESSCGLEFRNLDRDRVSVILGVASATELVSTMSGSLQRPVLARALRESGIPDEEAEAICARVSGSYVEWTESTFPGLLGNVVAGRIANRFDLGGTNCVVDAACASSLGAVQMAMQELWSGASDMVITGGVDAINDIFMFMCFSKTLAMSRSGDCKPFADDADGTMLGEGIGMFALRRLEDAERDGDKIYAVLRGIGASSDGRAKSIYAPRWEGQARALRRAYEAAGYGPETVGLVEAHGTGTGAGDAAEVTALRDVFRNPDSSVMQWCALGSIKSQIGHTKAAAGAASLYKAVMALHHKILPPTIKVTTPNPGLGLEESAFFLNTETRPWIHGKDHPRRASVSAFGFGGSNFHLTLEEYRGTGRRPHRIRTLPGELFLVSANDPAALMKAAREMSTRAMSNFTHSARESQCEFSVKAPCRLGIVASDSGDLSGKIDRAEKSILSGVEIALPNGIFFQTGVPLEGGIAFLFPGQGSQQLGMGAELAMAFDEARRVWDQAAAVAPDLPAIVFPQPAFSDAGRECRLTRLTATENAQPAIGITSAVYLELLRAAGVRPDYCAGHSFGEVSALFAAGVFSDTDFLEVARDRGRLMATAAATCPGAMLAVAASAARIAPLLSGALTIANINSPKQVVIAGPTTEIEQAEKDLGRQGLAVRRLPVSTAFHSPIVASAALPFTECLKRIAFHPAKIPVFGTSSAQRYPDDSDCARAMLGNQISLPVRFADQVDALYAAGARCFIEVGPGNVLTDLTGMCLEGKPHLAIGCDAKGRDSVTAFWLTLANLAVNGIAVDTTFAWRDYDAEPVRKVKPSSMAIPITGANYGKKYPGTGRSAEPAPYPIRRVKSTYEMVPYREEASGRFAAIEEIHQRMAEAHAATQRAMSESHLAYLRASEAAFAQLGGVTNGVPPAVLTPPAASLHKPEQSSEASRLPAIVPTPKLAPEPERIEDLSELVLRIVAEKTGYPRDILTPDMDLEADLGIDSIKRVQILAGVHDARPGLPEVDARNMASLRTLAAILEYLGAASETSTAGKPKAESIEDLVLRVVAEKTGYPREILALDMDLEADLGIDSIKRVQILSAVSEARPDLPEADAREMAKLRTLRAVLDHLAGSSPMIPRPIRLPQHFSVNGLMRLGMRSVQAREDRAASPSKARFRRVAIIGPSENELTEALAGNLRGRGLMAILATESPVDADVTIFMDPQDSRNSLNERAELAFQAAKAFGINRGTDEGLFVTVESGASALRGGLAALVKTIALEYPNCSARAIEIEPCSRPASETAEMIIEEILCGAPSAEVMLCQDGSRRVVEEIALPIGREHDTSLLLDNPVIVVSGGARGVTAACLTALVETAPVRLALFGRTRVQQEPPGFEHAESEVELKAAIFAAAAKRGEVVVPGDAASRARQMLANREVNSTLARLRTLGAEVEYFSVDVADSAAVAETLAAVRNKWGRVDGLIHAAGVVADKPIAEKSGKQFARVFGTKVPGFEALLRASTEDDLRFIYVFTSVAGRYGNAGQVDYAMANATMSQMARDEAARRGPRCVVRALSWGPWDGGMVTADLRSHFDARGVALIPMERGVAAFMQELCHTSTDPAGIDVVLAAHSPTQPHAAR